MKKCALLVIGLTVWVAGAWAGPTRTFHQSGIIALELPTLRTGRLFWWRNLKELDTLRAKGKIIDVKKGQECEELERNESYVKIRLPEKRQTYWTHISNIDKGWRPSPPGPPPLFPMKGWPKKRNLKPRIVHPQ